MNKATAQALVALNQRFYRHHADAFVASRRRPWSGWERLLPSDAPTEGLRVLDFGGGQGRLARFVAEHSGRIPRYVGVDASPELLEVAERELEDLEPELHALALTESAEATLERCLGDRRFDVVALFGVLHHLPGESLRRDTLVDLAHRLAPGGVLVASVWQLDRQPRFARKRLPWDEHNQRAASRGEPAIDLDQLDPGDHLLTWAGERDHPRYCHFPDDAEIDRWDAGVVAATGLPAAERWRSDGPGDADNLYLVYRAQS